MLGDNELQVLVCSANLGNAQPDEESLEAWIPMDGAMQEVVPTTRYPLMEAGSNTNEIPTSNHDSKVAQHSISESDQFDIIVIGMQEATFDPPTEGSTHGENNGSNHMNKLIQLKIPIVHPLFKKGVNTVQQFTANYDHTKKKSSNKTFPLSLNDWAGGTAALHALLEARLPSYQHQVSFQRGQMRLEVFCHESLRCHVKQTSAQNTGRAGLANKGGIVTTLQLIDFGTDLSFVTCHLEAHEGLSKYQARCSSMGDIFRGTTSKYHDVSLASHFCFVMGDLNFRTELPEDAYKDEDDHKEQIRTLVTQQDWVTLNQYDELARALRQKDCLVGFTTLPCHFPPTFKMERESGYQYIDKRRPSYTDRILWKTDDQLDKNISPLVYEPIDAFASSDHKPVRAAFSIQMNESFRLRPKLSRHGSMFRLFRPRKHEKGRFRVAERERLHLFVSKIECTMDPVDTNGECYLALMTNPEELLREKLSTMASFKKSFKSLRRFSGGIKSEECVLRTADGWPRTSKRKDPRWVEEDLHCHLQTHAQDGNPLDLTGAQLRLTLFNYNKQAYDTVVGTHSFNLVELIRKSQRMDRGEAVALTGQLERQAGHPQNHRFGIVRMFHRSKDKKAAPLAVNDPICSVDIDAPLLRDGMERGRLMCTVEAWYMDENVARIVQRAPQNLRRSANIDLEDLSEFQSSPQDMLSSRHAIPTDSAKKWGLYGRKKNTVQ